MQILRVLWVAILIFVVGCTHLFQSSSTKELVSSESDYWSQQRKGTNFFNRVEQKDRLIAARKFGLDWVRLTPSKWDSRNTKLSRGDFLIGSRNKFISLQEKDVNHLKSILDDAQKAEIKIVLTFLNLPMRYWSQHNKGIQDRRIWQDKRNWDEPIAFLVAIARALKGHPALVAYDLINEPSPEKRGHKLTDWYTDSYEGWNNQVRESAQDLNAFYSAAIEQIRIVDSTIPIIIETGFHATPWGIKILKPISDANVLYSFHMYEPFSYTFSHLKKSKSQHLSYPGRAPIGEKESKSKIWDKESIKSFLKPVREWQLRHKIENNRIVVGEFGVNRLAPGAARYFSDLIEIFDEYQWHWAFYSFREDEWDKMDYELGTEKPGWKYWQAIEKGTIPNYPQKLNDFTRSLNRSLGARN